MYKPSFGVVTSVLTVLCVVAGVAHVLAPHIPPIKPNRMEYENETFLLQGQHESVDWRPLSMESMAAARRAGRPILMVVGTPTSHVGQILDRDAFTDREIASYLRRNYTCLRVDGGANPQWLNAFLPFSRIRVGFQPDLQLWALDPGGTPFDFVGRAQADQQFDEGGIMPALIEIRRKYDGIGSTDRLPGSEMQANDLAMLDNLVGSAVPFSKYRHSLEGAADSNTGGFSTRGLAGLYPLAWRYFLMAGDLADFNLVVDRTLTSPFVDLLDGGFFHTVGQVADVPWVEFDKTCVENADAMLALAQAEALAPNPNRRWFLDETWNFLATRAWNGESFYFGQTGQEGAKRRSPRYSFAPRRLRDILPDPLRSWATENLGLDVARYPQAAPFPVQSSLDPALLGPTLKALRAAEGPPPDMVEAGLAEASLNCVARAIQTARILGERDRVKTAVGWLEAMEDLRSGDDVMRRLDDPFPKLGYLGDYLAYADARLQDYLATGRVRSLELGLNVMRKARSRFADARPGVWRLTSSDDPSPLRDVDVPEIVDNLRESCTARVIRLSLAYGRLLGDSDEGLRMRNDAHAAVNLFGAMALEGGPSTAGYFCAAAEAIDEAHAIAIGPKAQALADEMARRVPTRLVAPAFGMVRQDLQSRKPGIYVIRGKPIGPLTVEKAAAILSPRLDLGL